MKSEQTGGNSLGLESSQDLVIALFAASWSNEADNDLVISEGTGLLDVLEARARELEVTSRYRYLNYAWSDQDPIEGYGERSRQKLQRTSHRYDPHGVFQQGCPGGFKLF
ncbi:MAG: hypothetical protein M1831_003760 [Alyxoria varia]|nr:MAG: hypothetical protein M1831_003760 [Alyxoria varia]